jgi:NhaP-type Na+/H+ or K+/H+ antiporter
MALSLPVDIPERALLQEITFGIVLFTLLIQGTTIRWVVETRVGRGPQGNGETTPA